MIEKYIKKKIGKCMVGVIENDSIQDLSIEISYPYPAILNNRFNGIPHLYEHMVFGDIIPGIKDGLKVVSMAKDYNIRLGAHTSTEEIVFDITFTSLILPNKKDPAYKSLKRFDMSEDAMGFMQELLNGILRPHGFNQEQLDKEKDIILSEESRYDSISIKSMFKFEDAITKYKLIGSPEDINNFTLSKLHEFCSMLSIPNITLKYNPNIDVFEDIEYMLERAIKCVVKDKFTGSYIKNINIPKVPRVSENLYDGITDCHIVNNSKMLGSVVVTYDRHLDYKISSMEMELMKSCAISLMFDSSRSGSIVNILREVEGLTYTSSRSSVLIDTNTRVIYHVIPMNAHVDFESSGDDIRKISNLLDNIITNMPIPSETEYVTSLSNSHASNALRMKTNGTDIGYMSHCVETGLPIEYVENLKNLPYNFNYEEFREIFDEVRCSLKVYLV